MALSRRKTPVALCAQSASGSSWWEAAHDIRFTGRVSVFLFSSHSVNSSAASRRRTRQVMLNRLADHVAAVEIVPRGWWRMSAPWPGMLLPRWPASVLAGHPELCRRPLQAPPSHACATTYSWSRYPSYRRCIRARLPELCDSPESDRGRPAS